MARRNFKNIQIQSKQELAELFEDTYQQSGTNSKAEFLNILLDNYLNPEQEDGPSDMNLILAKEESEHKADTLTAENTSLTKENKSLKTRLSVYENDILKRLLKKHMGKKLHFLNTNGEMVDIEVSDLPDVYNAVINSIKI